MENININIFKNTPIIYFLKYQWEIVYIWESSKWVERIFAHKKDKIFDEVLIEDTTDNLNERLLLEATLINKYNPKYNNNIKTKYLLLKDNYFRLTDIKHFLKKKIGSKYNTDILFLKDNIIQKCNYIKNGTVYYIEKKDIINFIKQEYNIILDI